MSRQAIVVTGDGVGGCHAFSTTQSPLPQTSSVVASARRRSLQQPGTGSQKYSSSVKSSNVARANRQVCSSCMRSASTSRVRSQSRISITKIPAQCESYSATTLDSLGSAPDLVTAHIDVTDNLIAATGFLFAPAVVALADACAAMGCGANIPEGASFSTIELKSNFLSSA